MKYDGNSNPKPQTEEDITEAVWMPADDMAKVNQNTYASIKEVLGELKWI